MSANPAVVTSPQYVPVAFRRHPRIERRMKLLIEWDEGPVKRRADAVTVNVSLSGCMAVASNSLRAHQRVRLTNPENNHSVEARIVWCGQVPWHVGIELLEADAEFWGAKV